MKILANLRRNRQALPPIFGLVRFSVLTNERTDFVPLEDETPELRARMLFDPRRLCARFLAFEALTLPSLIAQESSDWCAIVVYSDLLPSVWRDRLLDLLEPHRHIHAVAMPARAAMTPFLHRQIRALGPRDDISVTTFRLDDDDALSVDFITRLRKLLKRYPSENTAFSFPSGYMLRKFPADGKFSLVSSRNFGIACGLALNAPTCSDRGIFNLGDVHRRINTLYPTVSDAREPVYAVYLHDHNDSGPDTLRQQKVGTEKPLGIDIIRKKMGPRFSHLKLELLTP